MVYTMATRLPDGNLAQSRTVAATATLMLPAFSTAASSKVVFDMHMSGPNRGFPPPPSSLLFAHTMYSGGTAFLARSSDAARDQSHSYRAGIDTGAGSNPAAGAETSSTPRIFATQACTWCEQKLSAHGGRIGGGTDIPLFCGKKNEK
jgi:hypothetical protein